MMKLIHLLISLFIGIIFLNTSISKILNFQIHLIDIKNYLIINGKNTIKIFAVVTTVVETFITISFFTMSNFIVSSILAIALLLIYSSAVSLNIIRGRTQISCGCGGVLESKHLSWNLLYRNIALLILILINAIIFQSVNFTFKLDHIQEYLLIMFLSLLISITVFTYGQILKLSSHNG